MEVPRIKTIVFNKISLTACACLLTLLLASIDGLGQSNDGRSRNNPYSPSPQGKASGAQSESAAKGDGSVSFVMQSSRPANLVQAEANHPSIARATYRLAKEANARLLSPTEIYKIGVGDVLYIGLRNSPQGSGYFTVGPDGSIDYPLAGENVQVLDKTVDSVEDILAGSINLFPDPQVEVKVRQYASHRITVGGLVENGGEKYLQREAIPLYVIRAEAVVSPKASKVSIRRGAEQNPDILDLSDPKTEAALIMAGYIVEFIGESTPLTSTGSYFIGGELTSGGQKVLTTGLTLYQAIVAAGGAKGDPKKAIVRRKNEKGLFNVQEYNLRSIKSGKAMDPFLAPGDVIEVGN